MLIHGTNRKRYDITRIETLSNDMFNIDRLGYADITDWAKYQSYVLHHGDILISHINSVAYLGRAVQYRGQLTVPVVHFPRSSALYQLSIPLPDKLPDLIQCQVR